MAPDYENLTLMQKVEVFQCALDNTTGQDLYKVLWLKSKNSEVPLLVDVVLLLAAALHERTETAFLFENRRRGWTGAPTTRDRLRSCPWSATSSAWATGTRPT